MTNGQFVTDQEFPAVPGMVAEAASEGYAIFFLTGRPSDLAAATPGSGAASDAAPDVQW